MCAYSQQVQSLHGHQELQQGQRDPRNQEEWNLLFTSRKGFGHEACESSKIKRFWLALLKACAFAYSGSRLSSRTGRTSGANFSLSSSRSTLSSCSRLTITTLWSKQDLVHISTSECVMQLVGNLYTVYCIRSLAVGLQGDQQIQVLQQVQPLHALPVDNK